MRAVPECYNCVLDDLVGAVALLKLEPSVEAEINQSCRQYMDENFSKNLLPSTYITEVHRIVKKLSGLAIPFQELRETCNNIGIKVAARVRQRVVDMDPRERFYTLVLWTIAGNHLDFRTVGAGYTFGVDEIETMLQEKIDDGLQVDQTSKMFDYLQNAPSVLYIPDNVGELAFDRLLIEEIKSYGSRISVPYRGGPITSDAVKEDFDAVGIADVADDVFCAGPDTLGFSWDEKSDELTSAIESTDLILAKGQANYYVTHEYRRDIRAKIFNLLCTKCNPVSMTLARQGKVNVAFIMK